MCTSNNHNNIRGGLLLQSGFRVCFVVVLLMQHEFCCVDVYSVEVGEHEEQKK